MPGCVTYTARARHWRFADHANLAHVPVRHDVMIETKERDGRVEGAARCRLTDAAVQGISFLGGQTHTIVLVVSIKHLYTVQPV